MPRGVSNFLQRVLDVPRHEAAHAAMHVFLRLDNLGDVSVEMKETASGGILLGSVASNYWEMNLLVSGVTIDREDDPDGSKLRALLRRLRMTGRKIILVMLAGPLSVGRRPSHSDRANAEKIAKVLVGDRWPSLIAVYTRRTRRLLRGVLRTAVNELEMALFDEQVIPWDQAETLLCHALGIRQKEYWGMWRRENRSKLIARAKRRLREQRRLVPVGT